MAKKAELKAILTLNNSRFLRTIDYSIRAARRFVNQLKANPVRTLGLSAVVGVEKALIGASSAVLAFKAVSIAAYTVIGVKAVEAAAKVETIRVGFETLLGSAEKASERLAVISKFSTKSPFSFEEIAHASRELEVMTEGALSGAKSLEMIGNVASGVQREFGDVAGTVGKLYAALRTGLPIGQELMSLRDMGAITHRGSRKIERFASAGTPAASAAAWKELIAELSRFEGMTAKMSNTWTGMATQFKNAIFLSFAAFGDPLIKNLEPAVKGLIVELLSHKDELTEMGAAFASELKKGVDYVTEFAHQGTKIGYGKKLMLDIGGAIEGGMDKLTGMMPNFVQKYILPLTPGALVGKAIEMKSSMAANTGAHGPYGQPTRGPGWDKIEKVTAKPPPPRLESLLMFVNSLHSKRLRSTGLAAGHLGTGLPESISQQPTFADPLGQPARRTTPILRFRERREIQNQIRAQEMALRYQAGNYSGRAVGDTRIRRGDRQRMMQVLRDQAKKEQEALTNKKFEEFIKKFDQFAKEMGGS